MGRSISMAFAMGAALLLAGGCGERGADGHAAAADRMPPTARAQLDALLRGEALADALLQPPDASIVPPLVEACVAGSLIRAAVPEVLRVLALHPAVTLEQLRDAYVACIVRAAEGEQSSLADAVARGLATRAGSFGVWDLARAIQAVAHRPGWDALLSAWAGLDPAAYVARLVASLEDAGRADAAREEAADGIVRHLARSAMRTALPEEQRAHVWSLGGRLAARGDAPSASRGRGFYLLSARGSREGGTGSSPSRTWSDLARAFDARRDVVRVPGVLELAASNGGTHEEEARDLRIWISCLADRSAGTDPASAEREWARLRAEGGEAYAVSLRRLGAWEATQGDLPPFPMPSGCRPQFEIEIRNRDGTRRLVPRQMWWPGTGLILEYWNWTGWQATAH